MTTTHSLAALRVAPESHVHPSVHLLVEDADLVRRTLAALPPDADPSQVHVVTLRVPASFGRTHLVPSDGELVVRGLRGSRTTPSRLALGVSPSRTHKLTVVVGPHDGGPVVYTAYWGEPAPREPGDPSLDDAGRAEAEAFWAEHALVPEEGEQVVINLTPHDVTVVRDDGSTVTIPTSGVVARVSSSSAPTGREVLGVPVEVVDLGEVEGLPAAQGDVTFIVSGIVRSALGTSRPDVVSPGQLVRDAAGRVIGCRALVGVR